MSAHGPDASSFTKASKAELKPIKLKETMAFMFESTYTFNISAYAQNKDIVDTDYYKFNVGHIEISKLIEFCLQNNLEYDLYLSPMFFSFKYLGYFLSNLAFNENEVLEKSREHIIDKSNILDVINSYMNIQNLKFITLTK